MKYSELSMTESIDVHGKETPVRWLLNTVLQWFGPFDTVVDTGLPCSMPGCNGRLVHVYEIVEVRGIAHKVVFTRTNKDRRVATKCYDSCTVPSCELWGEWTLVRLDDDKKLKQAYKRKTKTWRYKK